MNSSIVICYNIDKLTYLLTYYVITLLFVILLLNCGCCVSSDEDNDGDKTAIARSDAAYAQSCAASEVSLDAVSVATASTLLASGSEEPQSRDATSSTNHNTVGNSRHDLSFVCRSDDGDTGPPWLPASGDTLLQSDRLPSLQYGASGLLSFVYDDQSNASQSSATADHVSDWTAVQYTARSPSSSTSFSLHSPSSTTAAVVQCSTDVNAEKLDLHQADKLPVTSDNVVENQQTELSYDGVVDELCPSNVPQQNSTTNGVYNSSLSSDGYITGVTMTASSVDTLSSSDDSMSDVTVTADVVDSSNDTALLCDDDVHNVQVHDDDDDDEHPLERPDNLSELPVSASPVAFHVENYLLSDAEESGRGLTNGWTDTDSDTVGVLGQNDVVTDLTTSDVPRVLGTLEHTTDVNDTSGQTVQVSSHANDDVPTKLTATGEIAHDTAVDETSMSLKCNGVCVNGHLQSTTHDADAPCCVCRSLDDPPSSIYNDVNSNVTSHTSAISTSGDDGELDEIESRDVEKCHRVVERLSAAWNHSAQDADVLDNYDHDDADLLPATSPTLTTRHIHVR